MNTFAILSGDKRQSFIASYLTQKHYHAYIKSNLDFHDDDIIVCGTPFSKDGKNINCDFYSSYPIETFLSLLKKNQIVFGGNIPSSVILYGEKNNIQFIDVLKDENVVWNNAMLTAEGLIAKIIENTEFSICNAKALIIGFGKCGTNIAGRLYGLNSDVFIYDHTPVHLSQALSYGYHTLELEDFAQELPSFDFIVNTVPSKNFTEFHYSLLKKSCALFEIASKPYGFDPVMAEKYNLSLITCPGLPGATAPKAAGELIAQSIISYIERTGINGS